MNQPVASRGRILRIVSSLGLLGGTYAFMQTWPYVFSASAARGKLAYALSTPVPAWHDWNMEGVRTPEQTIPGWLAWILCVTWAASMAGAGYTKDKVLRPVLLLSSLFGAIACIGAGDTPMAVTAGVAVALAGVLSIAFVAEERRALKISLTGFGGALLAAAGIGLVWAITFPKPESLGALSIAAYVGPGILVIPLGGMAIRRRLLSPGTATVMTAILVAAVMYPGLPARSPLAAWRDRIHGFAAYARRIADPSLYATLPAYRPTRAEAAAMRLPHAEDGTDMKLLPGLLSRSENKDPLLHAWLSADDTLYSLKTSGEKSALRRKTLAFLARLSGSAPGEEMRGWLLLDESEAAEALKAFEAALKTEPHSSMALLGAGLSEAGLVNTNAAISRLTEWCLTEPRAVFSPAWDREPLAGMRPAVIAKWKAVASSPEGKKLTRYLNWYEAWERSGGDMRKFLEDPANNAPVTGAVSGVRERLLETLRQPDDAKIGSIFSAAVVLLTDRHVNLGQCHALYAACAGGDIARKTPERILISRPIMTGWTGPTEGGAGESLHDFEENLLVRLVTYGAEPPQY